MPVMTYYFNPRSAGKNSGFQNPDFFHKRNLVVFLSEAKVDTPYTFSAIQAVCRVGSYQAIGTLAYGIENKVLAPHKNGENWFTVIDKEAIKRL